jgi:deoxyribodipyrimidine photo-lyase
LLLFADDASMNKAFKPEFTNTEWEYNRDGVVASSASRLSTLRGGRSIKQHMRNRCGMVMSSFLSRDLMIGWRMAF